MKVIVSGVFDDLRSPGVRFLDAAARLGTVEALLFSDELARQVTGSAPHFSLPERQYFLESVRFVDHVTVFDRRQVLEREEALEDLLKNLSADIWAVPQGDAGPQLAQACRKAGVEYRVIRDADLPPFPPIPEPDPATSVPGRKKVLVTGCYDWLHSGHVRFFEEASQYGDLYVVVGNDANVRNLKGEGHPLYPQEERRYMAGSIRFVHQALVTSGWGWLDALPEIEKLHPDIYLVNEDGDKPEKRDFCLQRGLGYVVLKRLPKPGLARRSSTDLRGF
jgi:cytidyltransferase-like protein